MWASAAIHRGARVPFMWCSNNGSHASRRGAAPPRRCHPTRRGPFMNLLRAALLPAIGFSLSTAALAQAPSTQACQPTDDKQIAALFDRWNDSLRTLDPDKVVANYASDGVLLPTVSDTPRTNPAEIRDYFVK